MYHEGRVMDQPPDPGYIQLLLIHKCPPYPQAAGFSFLPGYPGILGNRLIISSTCRYLLPVLRISAAGVAGTRPCIACSVQTGPL